MTRCYTTNELRDELEEYRTEYRADHPLKRAFAGDFLDWLTNKEVIDGIEIKANNRRDRAVADAGFLTGYEYGHGDGDD